MSKNMYDVCQDLSANTLPHMYIMNVELRHIMEVSHRNVAAITKLVMMIVVDALLINISMLIALQLRHDMSIPISEMRRFSNLWPIITTICIIDFAVMRMYRSLWEYAGIDEVIQIILGTLAGVGTTFLFSQIAYYIYPFQNRFLLYRSTYVIDWLLLTSFILFSRFSIRITKRLGISRIAIAKNNCKRVMILGAGMAASTLIKEMVLASVKKGIPVVALDDDYKKAGTCIGRVPIKHGIENVNAYTKEFQIDEIVIALPSIKPERLRQIIEVCVPTKCSIKVLPGLRDVTDGKILLGEMRDADIADLLGRDEVKLDTESISGYIFGRTVLVTGGGGSIGSELCRQISIFRPSQLIIFDIYENNAYDLMIELKRKYKNDLNVQVLIGSVRDEQRLSQVFAEYRPNVVFHAAAHKHVPLMESSPTEAVKNNVFGTLNVARCADKYNVDRMVILSTDKAVNPTNIMGATKRVTELIMQYMSTQSKTHYMAVRFGNVLGSNGSVIPLFKHQIACGGPVTITDPQMTRYFMTIPEAAQLVLQAGAINESGAVFVLDMGVPMKIDDLARNLIRLSGFEPDIDIVIEYIGIRPGEKMYEELAMKNEEQNMRKTKHNKISVAHSIDIHEDSFIEKLKRLSNVANDNDIRNIEAILCELVPTFLHSMKEGKSSQIA